MVGGVTYGLNIYFWGRADGLKNEHDCISSRYHRQSNPLSF